MQIPYYALLSACLLLSACVGQPSREIPVRPDVIAQPQPGRFTHCQGYGCPRLMETGLSRQDWQAVLAAYGSPAASAAAERVQIARAVAELERRVGALTGTSRDHGGTFGYGGGEGEMDCIDEATNTTTYLRLLAGAGLLRWHTVAPRANRGGLIGFRWPHNTAALEEIGGEIWAVDSWFFDNGVAPVIVPLDQWLEGWSPEGGARS